MRSMHDGKPQNPRSGCHGRGLIDLITHGYFRSAQELPLQEVAEKDREGLAAS